MPAASMRGDRLMARMPPPAAPAGRPAAWPTSRAPASGGWYARPSADLARHRNPFSSPLAERLPRRLLHRARRRGGRGHRPGGLSRRRTGARSVRPPAAVRSLDPPDRGESLDRTSLARARFGARSTWSRPGVARVAGPRCGSPGRVTDDHAPRPISAPSSCFATCSAAPRRDRARARDSARDGQLSPAPRARRARRQPGAGLVTADERGRGGGRAHAAAQPDRAPSAQRGRGGRPGLARDRGRTRRSACAGAPRRRRDGWRSPSAVTAAALAAAPRCPRGRREGVIDALETS